jgi:hypothetical protein
MKRTEILLEETLPREGSAFDGFAFDILEYNKLFNSLLVHLTSLTISLSLLDPNILSSPSLIPVHHLPLTLPPPLLDFLRCMSRRTSWTPPVSLGRLADF